MRRKSARQPAARAPRGDPDRRLHARPRRPAGCLTGSLALLADAGHMLTDAVALVLAYVAYRMSERPGTQPMTYGFDRLKILVAYTNGLTVIGIALWIVVEAVASPRDAGAGARRADARDRRRRARGQRRRVPRPARRRPASRSTCAARSCTCSATCSARSRRSLAALIILTTGWTAGRPAALRAGRAAPRRAAPGGSCANPG